MKVRLRPLALLRFLTPLQLQMRIIIGVVIAVIIVIIVVSVVKTTK